MFHAAISWRRFTIKKLSFTFGRIKNGVIKVLDKKYKLIILVLVVAAILVIVYLAGSDSEEPGRADEEIAQVEVPAEKITESIDPEQDDQFKADSEPFSAFLGALNNEKPLLLYFYSQT